MEWILMGIFGASLIFIFAFSMGQLHLTWVYLKSKSKQTKNPSADFQPRVTIQLPIFNEKYVAERLIDNIVKMDYPIDQLEIQVLDDSDDETVDMVRQKVEEYQNLGFDIRQIQRPDRTGFKAGALAYGLGMAKGDFFAIFDADFMPKSDFLKKTVGYFSDAEIGCVQTQWGHLNRDYSILTQLQAFGLDAHFNVEQVGRNQSNSFINFNGTGGVWRKKCIEEAGGWSADTLTEDLDLSYRAQLKGWKFKFAEGVQAPAELPVIMPAIKSQQYRWNKGAAETARKNLWNVLKSKNSLSTKVHAFFHLLNSSVFLTLLIAALVSLPLLVLNSETQVFEWFWQIGRFLLLGFFSISAYYFVASHNIGIKNPTTYFLKKYPLFLTFSMGLSLHNAVAVTEGLLGKKTPFIRTPKFNVFAKKDSWKGNQYIKPKISWQTVLEGLLSLYFIIGIFLGILRGDFILIIFHTMLAIGFGVIFIHSMLALKNAP